MFAENWEAIQQVPILTWGVLVGSVFLLLLVLLYAWRQTMADRTCSKCDGAGVLEDRNNERCNQCKGTGKEPSPPMNEG